MKRKQSIKRKISKWGVCLLLGFILGSFLLVLPFRWINPPVTMVIAERWLNNENSDFRLHHSWIAWKQIPAEMVLAVVTAEDQRFPQHNGFDFDAIYDAIDSALSGKSLRGASTISQQVAKNMYLWTGRSWIRKGLETWFTMIIELTWSKQRILEVYLNVAEWGNGIFGIQDASYFYFSKPVSKLTSYQYALLASTLPSPLRFSPAHPDSYLIERAEWNLRQQKSLGGVGWLQALEN